MRPLTPADWAWRILLRLSMAAIVGGLYGMWMSVDKSMVMPEATRAIAFDRGLWLFGGGIGFGLAILMVRDFIRRRKRRDPDAQGDLLMKSHGYAEWRRSVGKDAE